jgi:radical SAM superfamily enzyme YgiQ (UPF0313 family)
MRILLVHAEFPHTYWGFQYALRFTGKRATMPPLGLCTIAAYLPTDWSLRLVDTNVEPLRDAELRWADAVLVGGMLVQVPSMKEVIARARALGKRTVAGGPAVSAVPDQLADADVLFAGEVEGRADELVAAICGRGPRRLPSGTMPALRDTLPPRLDLVRRDRYTTMSLQTSRGCPYACEFCDVIELFGRTPRVKEPAAVLAELDQLYRLGWRDAVFIVDDNFIGNLKAARALLPAIRAWQDEHGHPFELYTEASVNLAREEALLAEMVAAGFTSVFVGIETPSLAALREAGKLQNLRMDLRVAVDRITAAGIEVMGGFIVGFDSDDESVFAQQRAFLADAPIPMAMVGMLTALPGTALWRRLGREGRLRTDADSDHFDRPNFRPAMGEAALLSGYSALLAELYSPEAYLRRCRAAGPPRAGRRGRTGGLRIALRALWSLGIAGKRRRMFWSLVGPALLGSRTELEEAITRAIKGEHLIRYTHEDVLPRLRRALDAVRAEEAARAAA